MTISIIATIIINKQRRRVQITPVTMMMMIMLVRSNIDVLLNKSKEQSNDAFMRIRAS